MYEIIISLILLFLIMYVIANRRILAIVKLHVFIKKGVIEAPKNWFHLKDKKDLTIKDGLDEKTLKEIKKEVFFAYIPIPFFKYYYNYQAKKINAQ